MKVLGLAIWMSLASRLVLAQEVAPDQCAPAAMAAADAEAAAFDALTHRHPVLARVEDARRELALVNRQLVRTVEAYERVVVCQHPMDSVVAFRKQGALYEAYASEVASAARTFREIEPDIRSSECAAVVRYLLAVRVAQRLPVPSSDGHLAASRLSAYPTDVITGCVDEHRSTRDRSFTRFTPSDLAPLR